MRVFPFVISNQQRPNSQKLAAKRQQSTPNRVNTSQRVEKVEWYRTGTYRIETERNGTAQSARRNGKFLVYFNFFVGFFFDCLTSSRVSSAACQCFRLFGCFSSFLFLLLKNLKKSIHIQRYVYIDAASNMFGSDCAIKKM